MNNFLLLTLFIVIADIIAASAPINSVPMKVNKLYIHINLL
jgi:hypothetical protein